MISVNEAQTFISELDKARLARTDFADRVDAMVGTLTQAEKAGATASGALV